MSKKDKTLVKSIGRPAAIPHDELLALYIKYKEYIFVSDSSTELVSSSSKIWKDIENQVNGKLNSKSLYMHLSKNRNNIKNQLLATLGKLKLDDSNVLLESSSEPESKSSVEDNFDENYSDDSQEKISFKIILSYDEFIKVKPELHEYKRGPYNKVYSTLKPNSWTSLVYEKIWSTSKMPCNYIFKKNQVRGKDSVHFLDIFGKCKDCGAKLKGWTLNEPTLLNDWVIEMLADRPKIPKWQHVTKRFCRGIERREISKELINEVPSNWRRKKVNELVDFGDKLPPSLYDNQVLRQAKHEYKTKSLGITNKCPIQSLVEHKHKVPHAGSIHTISCDEAFVHYWSPYQIEIYKLAHKSSKGHCKVAIDATGGLVSKILRPSTKEKSHHFFLYEIVVYGLGIQESISQMVSEKQDLPTILYWLNKWQVRGVPCPNEIVTDMSRAILGAVSRAFCNGIGIKEYVDVCLQYLLKESNVIPKCFIRTDIAHFIKMQCRWKCFNGTNSRRLKEFYIRCSRLLIQSQNINDFKYILKSIFVVVYSETEYQAEISLNYLLSKIEGHGIEIENMDDDFKPNIKIESEDDIYSDHSDSFNCVSTVNNFLKTIVDSAKMSTPQKQQGSKINAYYLPEYGNELIRVGQLFPLWTNIMVPVFNCPNMTASSAPVESDFNQLKNRILRNECKPMKLDRFVLTHLNAISGLMKMAYDKINTNTDKINEENIYQLEVVKNEFTKNEKLLPINNNNVFIDNLSIKYENEDEKHVRQPKYNDEMEKNLINSKIKRSLFDCNSSTSSNENISTENDNMSDESIIEEENWRGQGKTSKVVKRSMHTNKKMRPTKYLEKCTDIKRVLNSSRLRSSKNTYLLNGNKSTPIKYKKKTYLISNTCAFDSIAASICNAYHDYPNYNVFISSSDEPFFKFCKLLALSGPNKEIYKFRITLLEEIFNFKNLSTMANLVSYDAKCSISDLLKKLDILSVTITIKCNTCFEMSEIKKNFITPNMKIIAENGFQQLEKCVINSLTNRTNTCAKENCLGSKKYHYQMNDHIFIEVDLFSYYGQGICNVSSIPQSIELFEEKYSLVSIVHYVGEPYSVGTSETIGHYNAHVRRSSGMWNIHDDLVNKVKTYRNTDKTEVQPHILFYVKN